MMIKTQFLNVSKVFREKTRDINLYELSLKSRKSDKVFHKVYHADNWNSFYFIVVLILIDFFCSFRIFLRVHIHRIFVALVTFYL